jgi:hypothetical protein
VARETVHKYAQLAARAGYLDAAQPLPDAAELTERIGPAPCPPRTPSSLEPQRQLVEALLAEGVEMMTIFDRLTERGYEGSNSSVRRFVRSLRPAKPLAVVRVHTPPGDEAQVDFGSAGTLIDPIGVGHATRGSSSRPSATAAISTPNWFSTRRSAPGWPGTANRSKRPEGCPAVHCDLRRHRHTFR